MMNDNIYLCISLSIFLDVFISLSLSLSLSFSLSLSHSFALLSRNAPTTIHNTPHVLLKLNICLQLTELEYSGSVQRRKRNRKEGVEEREGGKERGRDERK